MKIKITLIDIIRKDMAINKIIEKKNTCEDLQPIPKILELFFFGLRNKNTHLREGERGSNTKIHHSFTQKFWN